MMDKTDNTNTKTWLLSYLRRNRKNAMWQLRGCLLSTLATSSEEFSKPSVIPCCARSRGDTNRSEHHTAFSEMKKMTRKCAVSCQVVVRQFTDHSIL